MDLSYPYETAPEHGCVTEIAPGILWTRLPLPFRLDHVNVYIIDDGDGWAIVDCGIGNLESRAIWRKLLDGPLAGRPITRLIVTHHHPDHIGMAGWLCERLGIELWCSREAFLVTTNLASAPALLESTPYAQFYLQNGMSPDVAEVISARGHDYLRMISRPPLTFRRLADAQRLNIGGREFRILTGDGHAIEQVMLYLPDENLFFPADQVIEKISPNVSIDPFEPKGNPLGDFIASQHRIKAEISPDALVSPGHRLPFYGLHRRCDDLIAHHEERCGIILTACAEGALSANDILPIMFPRKLSAHETSFAFSETLAHMNYLVARGDMVWTTDGKDHQAVALA